MAAQTDTRFNGDIKSGSLENQGSVVLYKRVRLEDSAPNATARLPAGSSIIDGETIVLVAVSGAASGLAINVGTTSDATKFYTTAGVSAKNVYRTFAQVSGAAMANVGSSDITVAIAASVSAGASYSVDHIIYYVR